VLLAFQLHETSPEPAALPFTDGVLGIPQVATTAARLRHFDSVCTTSLQLGS
jgi:hypothetical protein